ncbi:MAG: prepilin-type N-terminal cleavage/methylation domain-containing protein [Oscillospiraceae bacterium]|nr:prepilin-type N-terminal cleavage/methylation domain-containing protein [Oscillospiraceae bacterium]
MKYLYRLRNRKGLTILEVIIATVIFSLILLAAFAMYVPVNRAAELVQSDSDAQRVVMAAESYLNTQLRNSVSMTVYRGVDFTANIPVAQGGGVDTDTAISEVMMNFATHKSVAGTNPQAIVIRDISGISYLYNIRLLNADGTPKTMAQIDADLTSENNRVFSRSFYGNIDLDVAIEISPANVDLQERGDTEIRIQIDANRMEGATKNHLLDSRRLSRTGLTWIGSLTGPETGVPVEALPGTTPVSIGSFRLRANVQDMRGCTTPDECNSIDCDATHGNYLILYHNNVHIGREAARCKPECKTADLDSNPVFAHMHTDLITITDPISGTVINTIPRIDTYNWVCSRRGCVNEISICDDCKGCTRHHTHKAGDDCRDCLGAIKLSSADPTGQCSHDPDVVIACSHPAYGPWEVTAMTGVMKRVCNQCGLGSETCGPVHYTDAGKTVVAVPGQTCATCGYLVVDTGSFCPPHGGSGWTAGTWSAWTVGVTSTRTREDSCTRCISEGASPVATQTETETCTLHGNTHGTLAGGATCATCGYVKSLGGPVSTPGLTQNTIAPQNGGAIEGDGVYRLNGQPSGITGDSMSWQIVLRLPGTGYVVTSQGNGGTVIIDGDLLIISRTGYAGHLGGVAIRPPAGVTSNLVLQWVS